MRKQNQNENTPQLSSDSLDERVRISTLADSQLAAITGGRGRQIGGKA